MRKADSRLILAESTPCTAQFQCLLGKDVESINKKLVNSFNVTGLLRCNGMCCDTKKSFGSTIISFMYKLQL